METERSCLFYQLNDFDTFYDYFFVEWEGSYLFESKDQGTQLDKISNKEAWRQYFSDNKYNICVCNYNSEDIGYISYRVVDTVVEIEGLIIKKAFRGKHYGYMMLKNFISHITAMYKTATRITLYTNEKNRANKLYQNIGFKLKSIEFNFFMNGECADFYNYTIDRRKL